MIVSASKHKSSQFVTPEHLQVENTLKMQMIISTVLMTPVSSVCCVVGVGLLFLSLALGSPSSAARRFRLLAME